MKHEEYEHRRDLIASCDNPIKILNTLGLLGWKLCAIGTPDSDGNLWFYLSRLKKKGA